MVDYGTFYRPDVDRFIYNAPAAIFLARMLAYKRAYARKWVILSDKPDRVGVPANAA